MKGSAEARPSGSVVDVLMITFNSAAHLEECLASVRANVPVHHLIVVDRFSTDGTAEIAARYGASVHQEESGAGAARLRAMALADTELALFVDGDVILQRPDFLDRATAELRKPGTRLVVGNALGHPFQYGLPLGLTLFPVEWGRRVGMSLQAQLQETLAFRRAVRREGTRVRYVPDAMVHRGTFRSVPTWAEFQGAQTRLVAPGSLYELLYSFLVAFLIHVNSRRFRNVAYTPIFWGKFVRGYLDPGRWQQMDRRKVQPK